MTRLRGAKKWELVERREFDASLVTAPEDVLARRIGLKVISLPPLPMIHFTTLSTSSDFARNHPDIVERFLKGVLEGIHFFKTKKEKVTAVLRAKLDAEEREPELVDAIYEDLAPSLEPKLYPTLQAIENCFELAKHDHPECSIVNPLSLWDLHCIREIDDSGFFDQLYPA